MITTDQFDLVLDFAKHWQEFAHSQLLVISPQGEMLFGFNNGNSPHIDWQPLLKQVSSQKPVFLSYLNQNVLATSLIQDDTTYGYLLAIDASEHDASLLAWAAKAMTTHLVNLRALHNMTDELIGAWNQLELIYRVTQNFALTSDLIATLTSMLQETQRVVGTESGFILFKTPEGFECVTCNQAADKTTYNEVLLDNLIAANQVVVCDDCSVSCEIWEDIPDDVKSFIATPLFIDEHSKAAIGLINKCDAQFTAGDSKLLAALAQQVTINIENFLTHQKVVVKERLTRELEIAAEIQESLLPAKLPEVGGVSMAVSSRPASEVGGDFYDFITIDDRYLTVVIGDVSGRGVPTAMLTSVARTILRVEAMRGELPHKVIQQANKVLHQDLNRSDAFVTVFVATVDTFEGRLTYASAGHTPALIYQADIQEVQQLKATSLPIGVLGYQETEPVTVNLNSGDTLVFYTDGVITNQSIDNEFVGLSRLIEVLRAAGAESPETLQQRIQSEMTNFPNQKPNDDTTILVVKMLPYAESALNQHNPRLIKKVDFLYPADIEYLNEISRQISSVCREIPTLPSGSGGDDFVYLIELAISEICTNIIKHAYSGKKGEISGHLTLLDNGVALDFYDQGKGFDPNTVPEPDSNPHKLVEGGYGLHIVRQIMDVVSYEIQPGHGNHWQLIKFLPGV